VTFKGYDVWNGIFLCGNGRKLCKLSKFTVGLTMDIVLLILNYKQQPFCIKAIHPSSSDFPKPNGVDIRAEGCIFYGVPVDVEWRDDD